MTDYQKPPVRNRFKTPEGRYCLVAERTSGLVPFSYQKCTRLTLAHLSGGGPEDGLWVLYSVGDYLHVARYDATHKDPARSIGLGTSAARPSYITCHDFVAAKDGVDTAVGLADGQVILLSLRTQLQAALASKPTVATSLAPEASNELARCTAVMWLPKSEGMLASAFASGNIYLYKKSAILGDSGSRFSLSIGSNSKSANPSHTFTIMGGGIHDMAASPCGTRLAAACRDGVLRLIDVGTGTVIAGFQSYYGALLCCSFSPDGRYIAAGGEDDLVAVYGVQERYLVAHCLGHSSWVSRVQWDPWMQLDGGGNSMHSDGYGSSNQALLTSGSPSHALASASTMSAAASAAIQGQAIQSSGLPLADGTRVYRIASVGQDTAMCLWDVQVSSGNGESELYAAPVVTGVNMRKSSSATALASPTRSAADAASNSLLAASGAPAAAAGAGTGPAPGTTHHQRKPSVGKPSGGITPSLPSSEMNIVHPTMQHSIHMEPISDVVFSERYMLTADHTGCIRTWERPSPLQRVSMNMRTAMANASGSAS